MKESSDQKDYNFRCNSRRQIITRAVSTAIFTIIITLLFYQAACEQQAQRLADIVKGRAALIEAMISHEISHHNFAMTQNIVLQQLHTAQNAFSGIGKTGGFTLAMQANDQIMFLLGHHHDNSNFPIPIPIKHEFAEPMQRALADQIGTLEGLDYRGKLVLAAYRPIPALHWGIVAKIDLEEVRAPYIRAGIIAMILATLFVSTSTFLALRSVRPIIKTLENSEEQFRMLAYHDILTKLPNRRLFEEYCSQAITHARRNNTYFALLFLDLDKFKQVNDELGHEVGDKLLQELAYRLTNTVREIDIVGRLSGDEFTILIDQLNHFEDVEKVVKKLLLEIALPFYIEEHIIQVKGSIGISLFPTNGDECSTLIKAADMAMYRAKQTAQGRYAFAS
ncbi:MAG: GGDEF domain-containing protein [Gammaproteobacteria bacterium]|nr:GGDEF domain-containing protein [Gammaproteobacteria bacterium]